jgi:hypothetical protein
MCQNYSTAIDLGLRSKQRFKIIKERSLQYANRNGKCRNVSTGTASVLWKGKCEGEVENAMKEQQGNRGRAPIGPNHRINRYLIYLITAIGLTV